MSPKSEEWGEEWHEEYHWHKQHHWDYPMLRKGNEQASCVKCHENPEEIPEANVLLKGHNVFLQKFFSPMTESGDATVWFADEFGLAVPLVAACFGLVFWRKGVREFGYAGT